MLSHPNEHDPAQPLREGLPTLRFAGRHTDDCNVSRHSHHCVEIILVTAQRCRVDTDDHSFELGTQQLLIVPRDTPHNQINCVPDQPVRTTYLGFTCDPTLFDHTLRALDVRRHQNVETLMSVLVAMHQRAQSYDDMAASALVLGLLRTLRQIETPAQVPRQTHPRLLQAVEYIQDHLSEPFALPDLAHAVSLSPSHLTALFRSHFHAAPMQYTLRMRMNLACRHLAEPYLSIKEIAARCGYKNVSLFIRQFKDHFGVSPGRWRKAPDRLDTGSTRAGDLNTTLRRRSRP